MSPCVPARLTALGSFVGSVALVGLAATAVSQELPRLPSEAEMVRIDAVVVDDAGRPVRGLTASDFEVEDDGEPRDIASFEAIVVGSDEAAGGEPLAPSVSAPRALEPRDGRTLLI